MSGILGGSSPPPPTRPKPAPEKPPSKDAELRAQMVKQRAVGGGIAYSENEYDELGRRRKQLGAANDILG